VFLSVSLSLSLCVLFAALWRIKIYIYIIQQNTTKISPASHFYKSQIFRVWLQVLSTPSEDHHSVTWHSEAVSRKITAITIFTEWWFKITLKNKLIIHGTLTADLMIPVSFTSAGSRTSNKCNVPAATNFDNSSYVISVFLMTGFTSTSTTSMISTITHC